MSEVNTKPPISTGELGTIDSVFILRQVYPIAESRNQVLDRGELIIGREPGHHGHCIADEESSRRHATVRYDGRRKGYLLADLNSRNGTYHNGTRIKSIHLADGDTIRVGRSIFVFVSGAVSPGATLPHLTPDLSLARALVESVADRAALSGLPILIYGPTGAGKERLASRIHGASGRKGRLVSINCGALPGELLGSELFGHVKGAFSGAQQARPGLFVTANSGTLFLDEIGELTLEQQPALLRACEQGRVRPVGADRDIEINVRLIAATHRNLDDACAAGSFRTDLLARLRGVTLRLPALKDRKDEILMLFSQFVHHVPFGRTVAEKLLQYAWPENVRELKNVAEYVRLFSEQYGSIHPSHLPERVINSNGNAQPTTRPDRATLEASLRTHHGNVSKVAQTFGVHRQQAYRWLTKEALDPSKYRRR
ncbi:MAG: sigma 54-interacting transcriptional regulator [Myxococcota bacterium]|nr:sigma 54-interacting transcriptional regulator [Myxococcota bacterium]